VALFVTCFHAGLFLGLFFDPEDGGEIFLLELFITTGVRTSKPTVLLRLVKMIDHCTTEVEDIVCGLTY
jgi:hypothetical protein